MKVFQRAIDLLQAQSTKSELEHAIEKLLDELDEVC
jgi:hypothetical protein